MPKWEYLRLDVTLSEDKARITPNFDLARVVSVNPSELIDSMDRLGEQNWELVSVLGAGIREVYFFKRALQK
jgi:hypothetical protein